MAWVVDIQGVPELNVKCQHYVSLREIPAPVV